MSLMKQKVAQVANLISMLGPHVLKSHTRPLAMKASHIYLRSDHVALPGVKAVVDEPYHSTKSPNTADLHMMSSRGLGRPVTRNRLFHNFIHPIGKPTYRISQAAVPSRKRRYWTQQATTWLARILSSQKHPRGHRVCFSQPRRKKSPSTRM